MLLVDLFLNAARAHADRIAVDVPEGGERARRKVTYAQLRGMAALVRERLTRHVAGEAVVVVLLPRETPWLHAAQIGVQWAGAAHASLDDAFPDEHVRHVVRDAGAVAVVTDRARAGRFDGCGVPVVIVDQQLPASAPSAPLPDPPPWLAPASLAYVIYTSGTTGAPKGVLIEHRGVVNLITQGIERFGIGIADRIAQGSSPAYDSSVEETWLALAAGATVVVLDDEVVRSGPDLVPWLRRERVTVLCPPPTLLRTTGCRSPATELPALRLCYVGGEPLSEDLVATWSGSLRLENGYGPTECTVTVMRGPVRVGEPVTIGEPVPPHVAHVLDDALQPVREGEQGELCIAGPGVARGYLGRDELTSQRFPTLPGHGRVYRTGDLVSRLPDGRFVCHGRIDSQVKVRGYRIELEAIEAVLAGCDGVHEVACVAEGEEPDRRLVAHVVTRTGVRLDDRALAAAVERQLPRYMVPSQFAWSDRLPRTTGGKVDRRALPAVGVVPVPGAPAIAGDGSLADLVRAGVAEVLATPLRELTDGDDFFALGGNSLRAAMLVTWLRQRQLAGVAVRDVYRHPRLGALIAAIGSRQSVGDGAVGDGGRPDPAAARPHLVAIVQAASLGIAWLLAATLAWWVLITLLPALLASTSLPVLVILSPWIVPVLAVASGCLAVSATVAAKRLLIGRYRPRRVHAWSTFRLRHWLVTRCAGLIPWSWLHGTELHAVVLRMLGARVGRRVHLDRGVDFGNGGWDLLTIGDDVTLGRDVDIGLCELRDGQLVIGGVELGAGSTLATRAGVGPDVVLGQRTHVTALSYVASGQRVATGERVDGVPARPFGTSPQPPELDPRRVRSSWSYTAIVIALRLVGWPLVATPLALAVAWLLVTCEVDAAAFESWLLVDGAMSANGVCVALLAASVGLLVARLLAIALLLRWLPRTRAGVHGRWTMSYWWLSLRMHQLEAAGEWLSGTLFWPWWLRLAGMRIARDVEVSSIHDVLPEHVSIGAHSFLADGVYLGVPTVHRGTVTVAGTSLGARTFVGNHVVVAAGQHLADDMLLGISTVSDDDAMRAGGAWFGHPPFELPQREVVAVDRALTHEPGPLRRANRLFWESLRLSLPLLPTALGLWWLDLVASEGWSGALFGTAGVAVVLLATVLVSKWLLLGRVRPGQHGLWSCWASRWDFHYVMWQRYARGLLASLEGTLWLPWYLRAMGMRIGRRCVLGDGFAQVVDPDMIAIEDGATVHALFQAHSFEDRVLKIDRVRIGRDSTVGKGAVILYGADIGDGARVMPHSVVMKRETLLPGRSYAGAPTVES